MHKVKDVTIYDIARRLNTSGATVSRALKGHPGISQITKERVFAIAEQIGYRVNHFASNLRNQRTKTVGILVHKLSGNVVADLLSGIESVATAEGYDLFLAHPGNDTLAEKKCVLNMFNKRVDGVIAWNAMSIKNFNIFSCKKTPLVFVERETSRSQQTSVITNLAESGYEATRHLIEQGCKRVMHVTGALRLKDNSLKFAGYRKALAEHHMTFEPCMVMSEISGPDAAGKILRMKTVPDGIFFGDDISAAHCMKELMARGISIPGDIAVVGFNNDPISELIQPGLTTISYPAAELGKLAMSNLILQLEDVGNNSRADSIMLRSDLIVRQSSQKTAAIHS